MGDQGLRPFRPRVHVPVGDEAPLSRRLRSLGLPGPKRSDAWWRQRCRGWAAEARDLEWRSQTNVVVGFLLGVGLAVAFAWLAGMV